MATPTGISVGIDVGGTKCLAVALNGDGEIVAESRRPTPRGEGSLPQLIDTLAELAGELGDLGPSGEKRSSGGGGRRRHR